MIFDYLKISLSTKRNLVLKAFFCPVVDLSNENEVLLKYWYAFYTVFRIQKRQKYFWQGKFQPIQSIQRIIPENM